MISPLSIPPSSKMTPLPKPRYFLRALDPAPRTSAVALLIHHAAALAAAFGNTGRTAEA